MQSSDKISDAERLHNLGEPSDLPEGWENWPLVGRLLDRDHMAQWVPKLWRLIFADNAAEITRLEAVAKTTQSQAVDLFIEQSCYDRDLPAFVGGKGAANERRTALRAAYIAMNGTAPVMPARRRR
jgi:hypothetical protein